MTDSSPAPTCYRHSGRETYVRCVRCDRPICPECMTPASVGFMCPDDVAAGRKSVRQARTWFGGTAVGQRSYVTMTLIALNVLVFLANVVVYKGQAIGSGLFGGETPFHYLGAVIAPARFHVVEGGPVYTGIDGGAYYRLFTAMFLHYGPLHLLMNMYGLWVLGRILETAFGPVRFAAIYLLAGLGGNVAAYVFAPQGLSAGASTAIFGLFAALFITLRKLGRSVASIVPLLVINLVLTFTVPSISKAGHLGGLVVGALVTAALAYAPVKNRGAIQAAGVAAIALLLVAVTLVTVGAGRIYT